MTDPKDFFKRQTPEEFFGPRISPKDFFSGNDKHQPLNLGINLDQDTNDPDKQQSIQQTQDLRDRGTYIIGKMGSGKTTLMLNMIYQDLARGNGLGVIAPEQEMITEQILPYIPKSRIDDVVYFNPADEISPVSFNPLDLEPGEKIDLKVDENLTIMERIVHTEAGEQMAEIFRQAFYALTEVPGTTLLDFRKLLDRENPHFRQQIISQLSDSDGINFWNDFYPQFRKDAHLPITNRLGRFTKPRVIRNILCQSHNCLKLREFMDTGKIVLFNLSDGILGERNSQLLGQLIVAKFQLTVMSRADILPKQRRPFNLYLDEFQSFTSTATTSYEKILSRARKYRMPLILAHQETGQLPEKIMRSIWGNISTIISFMVGSRDAKHLSAEFGSSVYPPELFTGLEVGHTLCKLGRELHHMKIRPLNARPDYRIRERVIERSRELYGAKTQPRSGQDTPGQKPKDMAADDMFSGDPADVL